MRVITLTEIYDTWGDGGWFTAQAMCAECGHLWQAVYPEQCSPAILQCPKCGKQNSITCDNQ